MIKAVCKTRISSSLEQACGRRRRALQYSMMRSSGVRQMTLMRLRVESNSRMLSTSYAASAPPSRTSTAVLVRAWKTKPNARAAATSAASSGDSAWYVMRSGPSGPARGVASALMFLKKYVATCPYVRMSKHMSTKAVQLAALVKLSGRMRQDMLAKGAVCWAARCQWHLASADTCRTCNALAQRCASPLATRAEREPHCGRGAPSGTTVWQTASARKNSRSSSGRASRRQAPPISRASRKLKPLVGLGAGAAAAGAFPPPAGPGAPAARLPPGAAGAPAPGDPGPLASGRAPAAAAAGLRAGAGAPPARPAAARSVSVVPWP